MSDQMPPEQVIPHNITPSLEAVGIISSNNVLWYWTFSSFLSPESQSLQLWEIACIISGNVLVLIFILFTLLFFLKFLVVGHWTFWVDTLILSLLYVLVSSPFFKIFWDKFKFHLLTLLLNFSISVIIFPS